MGGAASNSANAGWLVREFNSGATSGAENEDHKYRKDRNSQSSDAKYSKQGRDKHNKRLHYQYSDPGENPVYIEESDIERYTDIIVSIDMRPLNNSLEDLINTLSNKDSCSLVIYSLRNRNYRISNVLLQQSKDSGEMTLGCKVSYTDIETAEKNIFHILSVDKGGPADHANLIPQSDYIISHYTNKPDQTINIQEYISNNLGQEIILYVYNEEKNQIRSVRVVPDPNWKTNGYLGCQIGVGLSHLLPKRKVLPQAVDTPLVNRKFLACEVITNAKSPQLSNTPTSVASSPAKPEQTQPNSESNHSSQAPNSQNQKSYVELLNQYRYHFDSARELYQKLVSQQEAEQGLPQGHYHMPDGIEPMSPTHDRNQPPTDEQNPHKHPQLRSIYAKNNIRNEPWCISKTRVDSQVEGQVVDEDSRGKAERRNDNDNSHSDHFPIFNDDYANAQEEEVYREFQKNFPWYKESQTPMNKMTIYPEPRHLKRT